MITSLEINGTLYEVDTEKSDANGLMYALKGIREVSMAGTKVPLEPYGWYQNVADGTIDVKPPYVDTVQNMKPVFR